MARVTGTWLSGGEPGDAPATGWPGQRLGLPETGRGAMASLGRRLAAYGVDAVASALVGGLFIPDPESSARGLLTLAVFALEYLVLVTLTGQTLGMRLLRLRIRPLSGDGLPGFQAVAIRTALLVLFLPALVTDRDGRGLHDRLAGTVPVRA